MNNLSRGTAFGLGLSQLAIVMGVVLYSRPVVVHVYNTKWVAVNDTLSMEAFKDSPVRVGPWLLFMSLVVAGFSLSTYHLTKAGIGVNDYQAQVLEEARMWDFLFWAYVFNAHAVAIVLLCTPACIYGVALASVLTVYFLGRCCAPRCGQVSMTSENCNLLGLGAGFLLMLGQLGGDSSNLYLVLGAMLVTDYMLGVGHVWDQAPTMDTVINCRLFYLCSTILALALLYSMWTPGMRFID